ncbi:MAG: cell division protein ZapA [Proteobacteria bacterium]|nr:cell division protein ZapA [Pseudomonadota bacterium]
MPPINVEVNGRPYVVGCEPGEEEHVRNLARQFDRQVQDIAAQVGAVGELRLFLLAALTTADDLADTRARLDRLQSGAANLRPAAPPQPAPDTARIEQRAAAVLDEAAARIETLAQRIGSEQPASA